MVSAQDRRFAAWVSLGVAFALLFFGWAFAGVQLYGLGMLAFGSVLCVFAPCLHPAQSTVGAAAVVLLVGWSPLALIYLLAG